MRITVPERVTIEVELFGEVYNVVPVTKSIQAKAEAHDNALKADTADDLVKHYGKGLDLRLSTTRPEQPKPSKVVLDAWKADKVTIHEVVAVLDSIVESDRPT